MSLTLNLNGSPTASIPGSPSQGDTITMDNGKLRLSFTYSDHISTLWSLDLIEVYDSGSWKVAAYGRDRVRMSVGGSEKSGTDVLTIITNTATELTLKLGWSSTVSQGGVNWIAYVTFTMRSTHDYVEMNPTYNGDANYTGTVDLFGAGYMSAGKKSDVLKHFQYGDSPVNGNYSDHLLYKQNKGFENRVFGKVNTSATLASNFSRGYGFGGSFLRTNNVALQTFYDPTSLHTLTETLVGGACHTYSHKGYQSWWRTIDSKYQNSHDNTLNFIQEGITCVNPLTANTYTAKIWLNAEVLSDTKDSTILSAWNAFCLSSAGKMDVTASPVTLSQLAGVVEPTLASDYTTYFNSTYGFYVHTGDNTQFNSFANALALMASLRLYESTGEADYLTNATRIKDILLATFQDTSAGAQDGAFRKIRYSSGYKCQEGNHSGAGDQPHISMYVHAECMAALLDYYKVSPSTEVADSITAACDYLLNTEQSIGGWLVEQNTSGTVSGTSPNSGSARVGSATPNLGSILMEWAQLNPDLDNASEYMRAGLKAVNYWMEFEPNNHGCYEYGEGYVALSAHALRMGIEGFARAYRVTHNQLYKDKLTYIVEMAIAQTKKYDVVFNTSASNNKDIHTGGLLCTLDWNGQVGPEALSIMYSIATTGLKYHNNPQEHVFFYLWAMRHHALYGMRDSATYSTPSAFGYSYISPGTNYAAVGGLDNTRMCFHAGSAGLFLDSVYYLVESDNEDIYVTECGLLIGEDAGKKRQIHVYNPQTSTQTANLSAKSLSEGIVTASCADEGVITSASRSGSDLVISVSLAAGQSAVIFV